MNTLLMLAVLPAVILLYYVYRADPIEKEPWHLLVRLFGWGIVCTIFAMIFESLMSEAFLSGWKGSTVAYLVLDNFVVVAAVEEGCKFITLCSKSWKHPAFDYAFDGIVYAVFVSLGFAVAENIAYVFSYGFSVGVVRAFTAIPGHAIFAVFMGYFYGQAKCAEVQGRHVVCFARLVCAFVVAVLCHGSYDLLASFESGNATLLFFVFLVFIVYLGYKLVKRQSARAQRIR